MKRTLLALAFAAGFLIGCSHKDKADPKFDQQWSQLTQGGTEPAFIEGELHGSGLMGEVRRAVDPSHDALAPHGTIFQGPLPDPEIARVIRANLPGVKGCYAVEERAGTVGSGKAIVTIQIDSAGSVSTVKVDAPAFSGSNLPACVTARARSWSFPKSTQGPKTYSYPFVFVGG